MSRHLTRTIASLVLIAALAAPSVAVAADPPTAPQVIKTVGFENNTTDTLALAPIQYAGDLATVAFWGRVSGSTTPKHTGIYSLWCAGTNNTNPLTARNYYFYPEYTRGKADLALPQLADYYSAKVGFWYLLPSRGVDDSIGFAIDWMGLGPSNGFVLARQPGQVRFRWFDFIEVSGEKTGRGPTIDDIKVSGFKYGPVDPDSITSGLGGGNPLATADYDSSYVSTATITLSGSDQGHLKLVWDAPPRTPADATPDERAIAYRVWRRPAGGGAWTEITTDAVRAVNREVFDVPPSPGTYTYAVQAWDPYPGVAYGEVRTKDVLMGAAAAAGSIAGGEYSVDGGDTVAWTGGSTSVVVPAKPGQVGRSISFKVKDDENNWSEPKTINFDVKQVPALGFEVPIEPVYGSGTVTGTLLDPSTSNPLAGRTVSIQQYDGGWKTVGTTTTGPDGSYTKTIKPYRTSSWRATFAGDTSYGSAMSLTKSIKPKVYLTAPTLPSKMYASRSYTVYGYLKPRHTAYSYPVRIYLERYNGKDYVPYKYVKAKAFNYSTYTKYSVSLRLPYKGKWRVKARHVGDTVNADTVSGWVYRTVY